MNSNVPSSIYFDRQVMILPTLYRLGLEKSLCQSATISTSLERGQWVNRDEVIMTVNIHQYEKDHKPKFFWQEEKTLSRPFELKSPGAGLVIAINSGDAVIDQTLPVILFPKDEPPLNDFYLSHFYDAVFDSIRNSWRRMITQNPMSGDWMRLGEHPEKKELKIPGTPFKLPQTFFDFKEARDHKHLVHNVQKCRSAYLDLRDKLLHLVKE